MWRGIPQDWFTRIAALAAAAIVATVVTSTIVTIVTSAFDLAWIFRMKSASPALQSALGFDFSQSLGEWPRELLLGLLFGPIWAILFGCLGALAFLAVGFSLVPNPDEYRRVYVWTGATVGLAHSLVGLSLRLADQQIGPGSSWEDVIQSLAGWGGFFLTSSPRVEVVVATFPAACVAGALAGVVYGRIARKQTGRSDFNSAHPNRS